VPAGARRSSHTALRGDARGLGVHYAPLPAGAATSPCADRA